MGCTVSKLELRGRGTEAGLRSFKHKIVDDVSRMDRAILTNHNPGSARLLVKESVGRNSIALEKKDIVLGGAMELLIPQQVGLKDLSYHVPKEYKKTPLVDGYGATKKLDSGKTEIGGVEVKQIKSTNLEGNDEELEEGGSVIPDFDGPLWMASPSFREYCVADRDSEDDSVKGVAAIAKGNNDPVNISNGENLAQYSKDTEIRHDDNHSQHDDSPGRSAKRRRSLRSVLTIRRPAAVRNLFSVATCYNPPVPSAHNGSRKSQGKSV